jgi:hypothetical protein
MLGPSIYARNFPYFIRAICSRLGADSRTFGKAAQNGKRGECYE